MKNQNVVIKRFIFKLLFLLVVMAISNDSKIGLLFIDRFLFVVVLKIRNGFKLLEEVLKFGFEVQLFNFSFDLDKKFIFFLKLVVVFSSVGRKFLSLLIK